MSKIIEEIVIDDDEEPPAAGSAAATAPETSQKNLGNRNGSSDGASVLCKFCKGAIASCPIPRQYLLAHICVSHLTYFPFVCKLCNQRFPLGHSLSIREHANSFHAGKKQIKIERNMHLEKLSQTFEMACLTDDTTSIRILTELADVDVTMAPSPAPSPPEAQPEGEVEVVDISDDTPPEVTHSEPHAQASSSGGNLKPKEVPKKSILSPEIEKVEKVLAQPEQVQISTRGQAVEDHEDGNSSSSSGNPEDPKEPAKKSPKFQKNPNLDLSLVRAMDICEQCQLLGGTVVCPGLEDKKRHVEVHFGFKNSVQEKEELFKVTFRKCFLEASIERELAELCIEGAKFYKQGRKSSKINSVKKEKSRGVRQEPQRGQKVMWVCPEGLKEKYSKKKNGQQKQIDPCNCDRCDKKFERIRDLEVHKVRAHGSFKVEGKSLGEGSDLSPSQNTIFELYASYENSGKGAAAEPGGEGQSASCSKAAESKSNLNSCSVCNLGFENFEQLCKHEEEHSV